MDRLLQLGWVLASISLLACATTSTPKQPNKVAAVAIAPMATEPLEEESGDPERGVQHLEQLLRDFHRALSERFFDEADKTLKRAQLGVERASTVTRSHPDFDDTQQRVRTAPRILAAAIERDRQERRTAAIADLIAQGEKAKIQAHDVLAAVSAHPPQDDDLQKVRDSIKVMKELRQRGQAFLTDTTYRQHAVERDTLAAEVASVEGRVARQIEAQHALAAAVSDGVQAAAQVQNAHSLSEQVAGYRRVSESLGMCTAILTDLAKRPGYDPNMVLHTALGERTARATLQTCTHGSADASQRFLHLAWKDNVQTQIEGLKAALDRLQDAPTASAKEVAHGQALAILRQCQDNTDMISKAPATDKKATQQTPWGSLTAAQLVQRCAKEALRVTAALPQLHWLSLAEPLPARLTEIDTQTKEATAAGSPAVALNAWSLALSGLLECAERCNALLTIPGASKTATLTSPWGHLSIEATAHRCTQEGAHVQTELARTLDAIPAAEFAGACRGDETAIAQREGKPTQIEVVVGGRIFVYATPPRRFSFTDNGSTVDFALQFRSSGQALLEQLKTLVPIARSGGVAAQDATKAAMPLLEACQGQVFSQQQAGYSDAVMFDCVWGKGQNPTQLRRACLGEITRLRSRSGQVSWQVRLEGLRDRVNEAQGKLDMAQTQTDDNGSHALLHAALRDFSQCQILAGTLLKEPYADRSYSVASALGTLTVATLGHACEQAQQKADEQLHRLQAADE